VTDTHPQPPRPVSQDVPFARLFGAFLRLGATAFGGPAMIAYIRRKVIEQCRWMDESTFRDGVALCQTIPGATAMQVAAYVGLRLRGVAGAAATFIGFGLPAFLLMTTLSALYVRTSHLPAVVSAFAGLQAITVGIVGNATVSFGRTSLKTWRDAGITLLAAGMLGWGINPLLVILVSALTGLVRSRQVALPDLPQTSARETRLVRPLMGLVALTALGFGLLLLTERRLFELATLMCRIDVLAFGGGFASVPLMFHEIVEVRSWIDGPTFVNGIALGQMTPGPIVITATFVGYWLYGVPGAVIATVSVFLPSFVLVVGLVPHFDRLRRSLAFNQALNGILCSFVGLLLMTTIRFAVNVPWDLARTLLASAALVALLWRVEILWVVLIGTAVSVLVF
jgi:chromate transporter